MNMVALVRQLPRSYSGNAEEKKLYHAGKREIIPTDTGYALIDALPGIAVNLIWQHYGLKSRQP